MSDLLEAVRAERAKPQPDRGTRATDAQLDLVSEALARAAAEGDAAVRDKAAEVGRVVADGWSYTDPLSERVLAWADKVRGRN